MPSMIAKYKSFIKKTSFQHIYLMKLTLSNLNLVKIMSKLKNNTIVSIMTLFPTKKKKFKTDIFFLLHRRIYIRKLFFGNITGSNAESKNFIFGPKSYFFRIKFDKRSWNAVDFDPLHYVHYCELNWGLYALVIDHEPKTRVLNFGRCHGEMGLRQDFVPFFA